MMKKKRNSLSPLRQHHHLHHHHHRIIYYPKRRKQRNMPNLTKQEYFKNTEEKKNYFPAVSIHIYITIMI